MIEMLSNQKNITFFTSRPVVPKLFWFADHLEKFGGNKLLEFENNNP